jgi:hypothetical protein
MSRLRQLWARNRTLWITLLVMLLLFTAAIRGMETKDWVITLLRGLSVGAITFLVASGFSLIFGLMDVLNMAHGTFFMIGAYVGWTVVVRPDTFIDLLPPILIVAGGIALTPIWKQVLAGINPGPASKRIGPWLALLAGAALLVVGLMRYPITKWDPGVYANSPVTNSFEASQGILALPAPVGFIPVPGHQRHLGRWIVLWSGHRFLQRIQGAWIRRWIKAGTEASGRWTGTRRLVARSRFDCFSL